MTELRKISSSVLLVLTLAALIGLQVRAAVGLRRANPVSASDSPARTISTAPQGRSTSRSTTPGSPPPATASVMPSDAIPAERLSTYSSLAVRWMQEYLQIDTTNPPGNEARAAAFLKKIFDTEGIENRVIEYAPGRANVWARIPANARIADGIRVEGGGGRPIILLNHMDVVSSDATHWLAPPFSGAIVDGSMYGRGAQDMKNDAMAQLLVMVMLKREMPSLNRDVLFLATADEEVNDTGTDWMIAHHRDLLGHAEFLITEGGENLREGDRTRYVGVDVAEKVPFWLHVVAHGRPGHGSRPIEDSAPNRLLRALQRIHGFHPELKVLPIVEESLRAMAPYEPPERARRFRNIRLALQDKSFRASFEHDESLNYMLRNTIALTMLGGSKQTNVIPDEAWANLDVRLLPGEDPKRFLQTLRTIVADPHVSVEPLQAFATANSSPTNTLLFQAIRQVSQRYFPGAPVVPRLHNGYTESQRYRLLGIVCYGFSPYSTTSEEGNTEHGDNERIRLEELRRGYRVLYDVVLQVAGGK